VLDLCCNQIKRAGALAAARAVADKPALQLLALDENEISEAGVDTMREVLTEAFGSDKALGPMDDNDADGEDDEEDDEEEEGGVDELAAALAKAGL
jgi:Ran GTPase-activating protein 1